MKQKPVNANPNNLYGFINIARVVGTVFILLCHITQFIQNNTINHYLSQFFVAGVPMFFIISGFCFGIRGKIDRPFRWYLRRIARVYPSLIIFAVFLYVVTYFKNKLTTYYDMSFSSWLKLITGLQGSNTKIVGAEHTWFITAILFFYLLTPLFALFWNKVKDKPYAFEITAVSLIILYSVTIVLLQPPVAAVISPVFMYFLAFCLGNRFIPGKRSKKAFFIALLCTAAAVAIRVGGTFAFEQETRMFFLSVAVFEYLFAFSFIVLLSCVFNNMGNSVVLRYLNSVSYELYLFHYMFAAGPLFFMYKTQNWVLNAALVFIASLICAAVCSFLSSKIRLLLSKIFHALADKKTIPAERID